MASGAIASPRGWRALGRDAKLLLVTYGLAGLPIGLISVALPIYVERLGFGPVFAGTLFTASGLTAVVLVIPFGILADRYGRRRMTVLGSALAVAALGSIALAQTTVVFLLAAGILGVSEALTFSPLNAILAEATDEATRTSVYGLSFFVHSLAFAAGNLLAAIPDYLLAHGLEEVQWAYQPVFGAVALLSLAGPVVLSLVRVGDPRTTERTSLLPRKSAAVLSKFFASNIIIGLGAGLIIPLFTLWFYLKFGLAESATGPLLAVASVLMAGAYLVAPVLVKRFGMVRTIITVQAIATAVLFFIPIVTNVYVVGLLFVVRNLLMNMSWPVATSFLMSAVDESERAAASAVTGAAFRLPFAVSTTIGGYLLTVDLNLPFFVTTALYAAGTATFWFFFRSYRGTGSPSAGNL